MCPDIFLMLDAAVVLFIVWLDDLFMMKNPNSGLTFLGKRNLTLEV